MSAPKQTAATERHVYFGHLLCYVVGLPVASAIATQYVAHKVGYQAALGSPFLHVGDLPVYPPWQWVPWGVAYYDYVPSVITTAGVLNVVGLLCTVLASFALSVFRVRRQRVSDAHGSSRWGTTDDLKGAGLLASSGVVLAQTGDAVYSPQTSEKGTAWKLRRLGRLLRHNGPEHIMCFAPTRSGKGVGLVVPTLLSWTQSAVIYDIKRELWQLTAGWRRKFSHALCFEPASRGSVRFNPLAEVRLGDCEVKDAQNIAEMLVTGGKSDAKEDHWSLSARPVLTAAILHVLYAEPETEQCLAGIARLFAHPDRSLEETLLRMKETLHLGTKPHPIVAQTAQELLNKAEKERASVISTVMTPLTLYRDPIVEENTSRSDFTIDDLMNAKRPVSLYLVTPNSDVDRVRPLLSLMLNQMGRRLTERLATKEDEKPKHRLLMLIDELPSLGAMPFLEVQLAFLAGFGVKVFMIAQSLNQLNKVYGADNSLLDNCHVRVTYAANNEETAQRISKQLGEATIQKVSQSVSGSRHGAWLSNVTESRQEVSRALLTAGEVMQLPYDRAIVNVAGMPPYLAAKVMYYQDSRFAGRADLPTPESPAARKRELPAQRQPRPRPGAAATSDAPSSSPSAAAPSSSAPPEGQMSPDENSAGVSHAKPSSDESASSPVSSAELDLTDQGTDLAVNDDGVSDEDSDTPEEEDESEEDESVLSSDWESAL